MHQMEADLYFGHGTLWKMKNPAAENCIYCHGKPWVLIIGNFRYDSFQTVGCTITESVLQHDQHNQKKIHKRPKNGWKCESVSTDHSWPMR